MRPRTLQLKRLMRNDAGVITLEFALALPVLMTLFYGVVEITRYILIVQKVEKLAHAVADMTAQSRVATIATLDQVLSAGSDIMSPYTMTTNGVIFVTSLYRPAGTTSVPSVNWRYQGGGTLPTVTSQFGTIGATATMPSSFSFEERENVIAAEVYYQFSPLISTQFFGTTTIYRAAFYTPRLGELITPPV